MGVDHSITVVKEREVGLANVENESEFVYTMAKIEALGDLLSALPHLEAPYLQPPTLCTLGHLIFDEVQKMKELTGLQGD
jgi:hypothetical protein